MKLCAADLIVLKTRAVQKFAVYMQKYMQNQHKVAWYGKEHWIQLLINVQVINVKVVLVRAIFRNYLNVLLSVGK